MKNVQRDIEKVIQSTKTLLKLGKSSSLILSSLVEDVLDLSKLEAGTFSISYSNFKIGEVLNEIREFFYDQWKKKGLKLDIQIDEDVKQFVLNSDRNRIRQILLNLVTNSWKFTYKGYIKIWVCWIRTFKGNFVEFSVKDSGIGIKDEDQDKLFKLFGMVSDNEEINPHGCGIGLTVCQKFVEKLQGTIKLKSKFGKGTKVSFRIPYSYRTSQSAKFLKPGLSPRSKRRSEKNWLFFKLESEYQKATEFENKDGLIGAMNQTSWDKVTRTITWK